MVLNEFTLSKNYEKLTCNTYMTITSHVLNQVIMSDE